MNSRERLRTALNHSEPDRVPFDLGGTETSGISVVALRNWMALNEMPADGVEVASLATQTGRVPDAVVQRFGIDTRCLRSEPAARFKLEIREGNDDGATPTNGASPGGCLFRTVITMIFPRVPSPPARRSSRSRVSSVA